MTSLLERLEGRPGVDLLETSKWRCACGALNVLNQCGSCGRRAPIDVAIEEDALPWGNFPSAAEEHAPISKTMTRTAVFAIALGAITQGVVWLLMRSHSVEPSVGIRFGLLVTLGFYGVVALLVATRAGRAESRPVWSDGHPVVGALIGAAIGAAVAGVVIALLSAVSGHLATDALATLVVSEGTVGRIIVMVVILVICAPLVEEWLFRGLVAQSLRGRSRGRALVISAALFSVWHLRLAAFRYYFLVGLLLGALYLKRGLVSSIAAHMAFNGTLLVVAVMLAHGSTHTFASQGVSVRTPSTWTKVATPASNLVLGLRGPSGAELGIGSNALPGRMPTADQLAKSMRERGLPLAGFVPDLSTTKVVALPAGRAVEVEADIDGHRASLLAFPKPGRLYTVIVATGGSPRAATDAQDMLQTLTLG